MIGILLALGLLGATPTGGLHTASDIKGVSLVALTSLPHSPEATVPGDFCDDGLRAQKISAVGKQIEAQGWFVTSEAPLGRFRAVSFVSGFDPGTSALCFARNANIAVFDAGRLVALAYTTRSTPWPLGRVEPLENGAVLVWTNSPGAPVGELHAESDGVVRLTAVAPVRTFCHGRAIVPNVYGKSIGAARKVLIAHGWRPVRSREATSEPSEVGRLRKHGVVETDDCSGTGVGYCGFSYRNPTGILSVTTIGDDYTVVKDAVKCRR